MYVFMLAVGQIGVNYGRNGNCLPSSSEVVALYQKYGIQRMQIYDTDPGVLQAVSGSNIELTVGIPNTDLQNIVAIPTNAEAWVRDNISKYPDINFRHIVVGNEISPINEAHIYPYLAYINNPQHINIRYALLDPTFEGILMSNGVRYQNLFYAILDAVYAALEKTAALMSLDAATDGDIRTMEAKGAESGDPSDKGVMPASALDDIANLQSARTYINNLIQFVKNGTPKRPGRPIETYIFAMFDEDRKLMDATERHFGLFYPNGKPKYQVNFN
ncbi:hypothetical protein ACS0TY_028230 [Phlomoides rotata]